MKQRGLVLLIFFYVLFTCIGGIHGKASSGTMVSGILNQDTTWTLAGSPYTLTGDIQIANGVKLTVEPGVTIEGNNFRIRDFGEFDAIGNPDSKITFNNVNVEPGAGDYSQRFLIDIENADMNNGSLYRPTGNAVYGSLILRDSRLSNLSSYLYIWYPTSDVDIERNIFNNSGGISVGTSNNVKVNIVNNVFENYGSFAVENWASYSSSQTIVSYNSFIQPKVSTSYALVLPAGYSSANMIATNNYWGTTDEAEIGKMLFDKNDDLSSAAYINFKPYLLTPDVNTPDITPPSVPGVNEVTDQDTSVTGQAEVGAEVEVKVNGTVIGTGTSGEDGNFTVVIPVQKAGTSLEITATDKAGNESEPAIVNVIDVTPPRAPVVNQVTDQDFLVTGQAEVGADIEIGVNGSVIGSGIAGLDGSFIVAIPVQKAGTKLAVTATDKAENVSEPAITVVKDVTPPAKPGVHEITDQDTSVSGQAEAGSVVEVKLNGTVIGTGTSGEDGSFTVVIPVQKAGTSLEITATDKAENESEPAIVDVKDVTPPGKPVVNQVTDQDFLVTGQAEAGADVEVEVNGTLIGSVITGVDGNFMVAIPVQKAGTELDVTATDKADNVSEPAIALVKDVTPPVKPDVQKVTDQATSVTGQAEAGAEVKVEVNGTIIGSGTVGEDGSFTVDIPVQKAGTELDVTAIDNANNVSEPTTVVVKDATAPAKPIVNSVTDKDELVTGQAEAGSKIEVKVNGTSIGTGTTGYDGTFTVNISATQKAGTKLEITATDNAGNVSEKTTTLVKDITAPAKPTVNKVTNLDTVITGQAEAGSNVMVKVNGKVIGSVMAGNDGKFSVKLTGAQTGGTTLSVTAIDAAGNTSDAASVIVAKISGWVTIGDKRYYYDPTTFALKKGWFKIGVTSYYSDTNGVMQTGWKKIGSSWYYFNSNGAMQTGWLKSGTTWYYLNSNGTMQTGWEKIGSSWYYFNNSGAMVTGWDTISGKKYYLNSNGAMQIGWKKIGTKWYYLNSSGVMVTGWVTISGKRYFFYSNGVMK